MRVLVMALTSVLLITAIACGPGGTGGVGGGTGGSGGGAGGGSGGGSAGGGSGGGSAGGGSGGGSSGGGMGGGGGSSGTPRLFGITWNGNVQMDAGQYELRRIDPTTGASTFIAVVPDPGYFSAHTVDQARGILYVVTFALVGGPKLLSIDATTGAILRTASIDRPDAGDYNWSGGIHLRPDGGLVGVTWNGAFDAGSEELRTLDPITGNTATVAALPGMNWLLLDGNASDPARALIHVLATGSADPSLRLFSVRMADGTIANSPIVDTGPMDLTPFMLFPRANGSIRALAAKWAGDAGTVAFTEIHPADGGFTHVATVAAEGFQFGARAFDPVADRAYFIDGFDRLFTVDTATGAVLANPFVDGTDAGRFPYQGGLYFLR